MSKTVERVRALSPSHPPPPLEIAEAKLLRPPARQGTVHRPAIVDQLTRSPTPSLITIVAPPGYGKTTLMSDWAERDGRPFAWVSVDEGDGDPVVFLSHVAVALDRIERLDAGVFEAIASPGAALAPGRAVRRIGACLAKRSRDFVLVLDDLDRTQEPLCTHAIAELARYVGEGSAIAIAARSVPDVGLPLLRAEGRLVELGVEDLSLDADSARSLLQGAGFRATKAEAQELTDATEGWPVGLYLAGLSRHKRRRSGLRPIRFTGEDRYVVDYIRSEVLDQLSRERQRFLMRTSILERLSGPLCDTVLERSRSARTLESIERENLLLVPLDRERNWYRYHHLFRDVLVSELHRREPQVVPELYRRAADWYESLGLLEEALKYAGAGGHLDRASVLLQRQMLTAYRNGRNVTIRTWLDRLGEIADRDAGLAIVSAWIAALNGEAASADHWLGVAERLHPSGLSAHGTASLESSLALVRAILSRDGPSAMQHDAEHAIRAEPEGSPFGPAALALLGMATLLDADPERADGIFTRTVDVGEPIGAFPSVTLALAERSLIAAARGDPGEADALAARAVEMVRTANLSQHVTSGPVYAASAHAALRAGDTEQVQENLAALHRLRPMLSYAFPSIAVQTRLEAARVEVGLSDAAGARTLLAEIGDILAHRPDLGVLVQQSRELREHVGTLRSSRAAGASTLTAAELRILSLLPTYLSFREIGGRLFVSPNTVKSQAISIYRKLGVSSRSDAVEASRRVGLLEP
jgi:LuxR family transcriptional regulator, maltose regulon positive regulatory protein